MKLTRMLVVINITASAVCLNLGVPSLVHAKRANAHDRSQVGIYVKPQLELYQLTTQFNGQKSYRNDSDRLTIDVPQPESSGKLFGGYGGVRLALWDFPMDLALEMGYLTSNQDAKSYNRTSKFQYNLLDCNIKTSFFTDKSLQPSLILGVNIPWYKFKNAAYHNSTIGDATYSGLGYNLGAALSLKVNRYFQIEGMVVQRWQTFTSVQAFGQTYSLSDSLSSSTLGVAFNGILKWDFKLY